MTSTSHYSWRAVFPLRLALRANLIAMLVAWSLAAENRIMPGLCCQAGAPVAGDEGSVNPHPRLYFQQRDLEELRSRRRTGIHARIWKNMVAAADWCRDQSPRREWIPTLPDDPIYENLYDRFYAAMHDMAIVEHLALTSALSDPADDPYFDAARAWTLAAAKVWRNEATNSPDASKAYAVLRVMKALAVSYDALFARLTADDRSEIRRTLLEVGNAYHEFFQIPSTAGEGYNKHHGSVDAAPFGVMGLALLGEAPAARDWLELAIKKHVDYLLPRALTPSGTSEQSSNFWASTLQYRIFFIDALRRTTGRDLFAEFPDALPGNIALAAVAGQQPAQLEFNEDNRSVLFGPSYGQIDYWSPVLLYLAQHHRSAVYQRLALWDQSLGSLQRTRYITPNRKEELLFAFGPYAYLWCDPNLPTTVDASTPLSFEFPEPEVNEVYLRSSFDPDDLVVGVKKGGLIVHAGGRAVMCDKLNVADINNPAKSVPDTQLQDDGRLALITCTGPADFGIEAQTIELRRPSTVSIDRRTRQPLTWWYAGNAHRDRNTWTWPDGTRLSVRAGIVEKTSPAGHVDKKTHYGGMEFADPHPFTYPTVTVKPQDGRVRISVSTPRKNVREP